ncbi:hypothetical protein CR513_01784, partial [Mucuna pruriens]
IPEDYIKMKVFPFSLDVAAKSIITRLCEVNDSAFHDDRHGKMAHNLNLSKDMLVLFKSWGDMKCMFLEKFFLASRTATIRKEICGIRQHSRETMYKCWERFNMLCATYPHHQINDEAPNLKYGKQRSNLGSEESMVDNLRMENQLIELTSLLRQLIVGQYQPNTTARVCGICTSMDHPTDMCPTLQETESNHPERVGLIGGYQYGKQLYQSRPYDSQQFGRQQYRLSQSQGQYLAQKFRSAQGVPQGQNSYQPNSRYQAPPFQQQQQQRVPSQGNSLSLEDLMKQLATRNLEFQHTMNSKNMQF